MKADEALRLYKAGKKNFHRVNLRGQSFKGKNLSDADFTEANIQGANFTNANLKGTNFSDAKAGLQHRWAIALVIVSPFLSALSGFIASWAGVFVGNRLENGDPDYILARRITITIVLAVFFFVTISKKDLATGLRTVAVAGVLAAVLPTALAVALTVTGVESGALAGALTGSGPFGGMLACAGAVVATVGGALAVAVAVGVAEAAAGAVGVTVAVTVALAVGVAGAVVGTVAETVIVPVAGAWAGATTLLGGYVARRALAGDDKFVLIRRFIIAFATTGGTSFRGADLTDANFTKAILKNTDLRNATLERTRWRDAKKLDWARVGGTILINLAVQDLVVTGNGKNKSFVGLNFKGANLEGAEVDLRSADLTEADISGATLQRACLEGANLTRTQALGTNFNRVKLTGACLEGWNIDSTTQLAGIECQFVYLLENPKPGTDDRERRPPNDDEFKPGDFTKLFQEVLDTVDLILRNRFDLEALTYSFKKLQVENEDIKLSIRSIENKGEGVVVVKVNVPADVNKSKIYSEFAQNHEAALKAIEERYQAELKSKDEQISIYRQHQSELQEVIKIIASRPVHNLETGILVSGKALEGKVVILKLGKGNFKKGFPVTLEIRAEGTSPFMEINAELSSAPEIPNKYKHWQSAYRKSMRSGLRIDVPETQITNVSKSNFIEECHELADDLEKHLNLWLNCEQFRPIKERLLENLMTSEEIRVIWQTEDMQLQRLPWHLWDFFERYRKAEIALSLPAYKRVEKLISPRAKIRILAILGDSTGIDIQKDQAELERLTDAKVKFLEKPQLKELTEQLWFQPLDILFFAGHSSSQVDGDTGRIYINQNDSLSIRELKNALTGAIEQGLQLAIFNSCDGLGLARELSNLNIPQIIIMRELVPDLVAQEFLKHFLKSFVEGKSLYLAVREARERLQGLEDRFPCSTWLPVVCQNPAEVPNTWQGLRDRIRL